MTDPQAFLNIIGAALRGVPPEADPALTPERLCQLSTTAAMHHVLPLFYEATRSLPGAEAALAGTAPTVRRQVMLQAVQTDQLLTLLQRLAAKGLHPLVVKGYVCRSLYPLPDHRPSSDEDLLIPAEDFSRCCLALTDLGYVTDDPEDAFERTYRSPSTGLRIELHRQLFDPQSPAYGSWNRFFDNAHNRACAYGEVFSLCPTDHILYLLLHAFKHFLHSGFGIRQVCDIVLFAEKYRGQIQWESVDRCLTKLRADRFAAALFLLGQQYWHIPAPLHRETDPEPLLADLMQAGIYGGSSTARKHSSNMTLSAAANKNHGSWLGALFPPRSSLTRRFPYLKKHPWLLPWAWLCRILTYKNNRSSKMALQIGNQRLALLRLYGVIEE